MRILCKYNTRACVPFRVSSRFLFFEAPGILSTGRCVALPPPSSAGNRRRPQRGGRESYAPDRALHARRVDLQDVGAQVSWLSRTLRQLRVRDERRPAISFAIY